MKSYTGVITGNIGKADYLRDQLSVIEDLSWYCFELGRRFGRGYWWTNATRLYNQCRRMFPELNSKVVQTFVRFHFVSPKAKPKKPPRPSLYVDYQSFGLKIDKTRKFSWLWIRFHRRNFPVLGKFLLDRIEDPSRVKLVQVFSRKGKLRIKFAYDDQPVSAEGRTGQVGLDVNVKRVALSTDDILSLKRLNHRKVEHRKNKQRGRCSQNYTLDFVHKLTTEIADRLLEQEPEVLVLENLKHIRKSASRKLGTSKGRRFNFTLNGFPFRLFQTLLGYKCQDRGIKVVYVEPAYTSKTCSRCGSRNTTRPSQPCFACRDCGVRLDADLNAARNIRGRYQRPEWGASESIPTGCRQSKPPTLVGA